MCRASRCTTLCQFVARRDRHLAEGSSKLHFHLRAHAAEAGRLLHHSAGDRDEDGGLTAGPTHSWASGAEGMSKEMKPEVQVEVRKAGWMSQLATGRRTAGSSIDTDRAVGLLLMVHQSSHSNTHKHISMHCFWPLYMPLHWHNGDRSSAPTITKNSHTEVLPKLWICFLQLEISYKSG